MFPLEKSLDVLALREGPAHFSNDRHLPFVQCELTHLACSGPGAQILFQGDVILVLLGELLVN